AAGLALGAIDQQVELERMPPARGTGRSARGTGRSARGAACASLFIGSAFF
ncbi:hypothetical protein A2U01_0076399, partial [Trifolium medium]|nr:hypothetical protein [Trifolium medium]